MYGRYTSERYEFCTTTDWEKFTKIAETAMRGAFTPRHGSVLPITADEYNKLLTAFPTRGLEFEESTTRISAEKMSTDNPEIYDITGRRVSTAKPSSGIYIRNGKKVFINK